MKNRNDNKTLYGLKIETLGKSPIVEITQDEFILARDSMRLQVDALEAEEGLNLVLENYIEYETELFGNTLRSLLQQLHTWAEFNEKIFKINRRVVNLLSGCRSYLDKTKHFLSRHYGSSSKEFTSFCDLANTEYKERLGFRVMEELRNTALHRGIAVHSLSDEHWINDKEKNPIRRNTLSPFIDLDILAGDEKFKKSILYELREKGNKVNVRPLINSYVTGIVNLHLEMRKTINIQVKTAESSVLSLIERYKKEAEKDCSGLIAAKFDKNRKRIDRVPLFEDPITRRKMLEKRTKRTPVIEKVYITNEIREKK